LAAMLGCSLVFRWQPFLWAGKGRGGSRVLPIMASMVRVALRAVTTALDGRAGRWRFRERSAVIGSFAL
jgi:hypothetical protein